MKHGIYDISDETYFGIGDIFEGWDAPMEYNESWVLSNSATKQIHKENLYTYLSREERKIDEDLQEIFDVGSGAHCYVLENSKFEERYYISNVTDPAEDRTRIKEADYIFMQKVYKEAKNKYPYLTDEIYAEMAIFADFDGVPVKSKLDKIRVFRDPTNEARYTRVEIYDLKTVWFDFFKLRRDSRKDRWELKKKLFSVDYDLQVYFYKRIVEEWLKSIGQVCEVDFYFVLASKETGDVAKFQAGDEFHLSGEEKFRAVWSDISDFYFNGTVNMLDYEVL